LWDSSPESTDSIEKLVDLLRNRFGGSCQMDKYRMELRLRRRNPGESLSALHRDIRKLMALAHPNLVHDSRETIACDYFIDALDDLEFALKVRERTPASLDDAVRVALQLQAWSRDSARQRGHDENSSSNLTEG